jgi:hypothetical protein
MNMNKNRRVYLENLPRQVREHPRLSCTSPDTNKRDP